MTSTTTTVKFLMIGLFIAAGLVVIRVGVLINKTFHPAVARIYAPLELDYEDSDDFDHDGLSNTEEAVWGSDPYNPDTDGDGYLDGEEIVSDHSPLLASDDSLSKTRDFLALNSTERLSGLIVGGLLSGDLKKSSNVAVYDRSIDALSTDTVYTVLSALESVESDVDIVNTVEATKENQEQYLQEVFSAITGDIIDLIYTQPKELVLLFSPDQNAGAEVYTAEQKERIKTRYLQHSIKFQQAHDRLAPIAIPHGWESVHRKTMSLLKKLELYYRSIALSTDDPMKLMIVLGNLQSVYLESQPIMIAIDGKIKSGQLKSPDNDFFNISLLLIK